MQLEVNVSAIQSWYFLKCKIGIQKDNYLLSIKLVIHIAIKDFLGQSHC